MSTTASGSSESSPASWGIVIFLLASAAYLLLFFMAPQPSLHGSGDADQPLTRITLAMWLWLIRLPALWAEWTGGSGENIGFAGRLGVLFVATFILACAYVVGELLLELLSAQWGRLPYFSRVERFVFAMGVGLNAVSLFTLVVGLVGWLQHSLVYAIPAAGALIFASILWRSRGFQRTTAQRSETDAAADWLRPSALWLAAPFVLVIVLGGMLPPQEFDVREYHLQAPKEWFQQGYIGFMPHNIYANMPLGPEILSLPAMAIMPGEHAWWWGALAGKLIIASYAPLTALALFAAGRRFFSVTAGVVAAVVYISIPWIAHVSMEGLIDGALAFYLFLATYAVMLALRGRSADGDDQPVGGRFAGRHHHSRSEWSLFLLAGFLAGAAVSCKYTGLLFVVFPLAVAVFLWRPAQDSSQAPPSTFKQVWQSWRNAARWKLAARSTAIFLLAVLMGCGLWLGKNWVLAGNPTYPLLVEVFGGKTRTAEKNEQWQRAHAVPQNEQGHRYSPRQFADAAALVGWRSEWLSPLVVPLLVLAFLIPRHRAAVWCLAGMLLFVLLAWWLATHRIDRFWIPVLPLAALLAGAGATWRDTAWWRRVVIALLFWGLAWNLLVIAGALIDGKKMLVALERLRNDPARVHAAHLYLNQAVPPGKKVLLVGDAQPFDLEADALYATCFDDCLLEKLTQGKSRQECLRQLRKHNISHVYVRWAEIDRYRSPGNYGFSDYVTAQRMSQFVKQGVLKKPWGRPDPQTGKANRNVGEIYPVAGNDSSL